VSITGRSRLLFWVKTGAYKGLLAAHCRPWYLMPHEDLALVGIDCPLMRFWREAIASAAHSHFLLDLYVLVRQLVTKRGTALYLFC